MLRTSSTSQVWQVYGYPADINGRGAIRWASEPTGYARESVSVRVVAFLAVPTLRTRPAGIARVYEENRHSGELRFVDDKLPQLSKAPWVQRPPLRPSNPYPGVNPLQVLESDATSGALSRADYAFGDGVIRVGCHPPFFSLALLEELFCRLAQLRLKSRPDAGVAVSKTTKLATGVGLPVRVDGDILDTEVHPEPVFRLTGRRRFVNFDRSEQRPFALVAA